jgi:hypothetical protein
VAATLPIRIHQGTLWRRRLRLRTGTVDDSTPLDLTGHTLHAQVRRDPLAAIAVPLTIENPDLPNGEFDILLDDRPRHLPPPPLRWDLLLQAPDGTLTKLLQGTVELLGTVTRPT